MRWLLIFLLFAFPVAAEDGKSIYEKKCQMCHGEKGDGQKDKGVDFSDPEFWKDKSYEEVYDAIKNGKGKMPAFPELSDEEIKSVIEYIRSLAPTPTPTATPTSTTPEKIVTEKKSPGFGILLILAAGALALRKIR
ncbi:cytochrome c class I [Ferroglobus placidus DSM 10642]|uniref:Cytochrome c class I n=1 Tax=Ferroglobus placidus (strain DSM 10642 / AEDII12DO) TaxID=589924 RepID=D3RYC7_FERPA|nr:cytochrome c [Ferroglobus placidus]ADC65490.1 cytochrome c class I [Ferroglobus placidus DSM 10642]